MMKPKITASEDIKEATKLGTYERLRPGGASAKVAAKVEGTIKQEELKLALYDAKGNQSKTKGDVSVLGDVKLSKEIEITVSPKQQTKLGEELTVKSENKEIDDSAITNRFAIASYPQNWDLPSAKNSLVDDDEAIMEVSDAYESDGVPNDYSWLDEVMISEQVQGGAPVGPLTVGPGDNSDYLDGDSPGSDSHTRISYGSIDKNKLKPDKDGTRYDGHITQTCIFKCGRTDVKDKVVPNSGYELTDSLERVKGRWKFWFTKIGKSVTANGYHSGAGKGNHTSDAYEVVTTTPDLTFKKWV
ncbi:MULTISPECIES: hypothetical protein [Pseudoalteromonas]|uniref:Uncharacterized protein n=1 Tax=Pseudoalteromonas obscura TaxID=3048491 RepID=A0ABT7EKR4_9GAMM|nr:MULTISPECIES: hypothetical protein [Pseudoalteromonas]MBQ4837138.1 hypothetical protein [Pseudoalteromonas luteoviolacea]MDK2595636.1 hypothetical protein [Pseudoalteromonas sp. P94(2023)]